MPQAGDKDHVGEGRGSTFSSEAGTASWTNEGLSSYLVCVVEGTAENAPQGAVDIGIVAIETSTGDVLHAQFRYPDLSFRQHDAGLAAHGCFALKRTTSEPLSVSRTPSERG